MDELRELFGDGSLTYEDFNTKVTEKGYKLADLSKGAYIAKDKADRQQAKLQAEYDEYRSKNDVSKYADYDAIKTERDALLSEKKAHELNAILSAANVPDQFKKFVTAEVGASVTETKDFKTCLAEYLEANPQFVAQTNPNNVFFKNTQPPLTGGNGSIKTPNKDFNDWIRGKK